MAEHRIFSMKFSSVYPLYVAKAERKGRTRAEVEAIICWLTGYSEAGLQQQVEAGCDFRTFFAEAPAFHPNSAQIQLIDELAQGKAMGKILRLGLAPFATRSACVEADPRVVGREQERRHLVDQAELYRQTTAGLTASGAASLQPCRRAATPCA